MTTWLVIASLLCLACIILLWRAIGLLRLAMRIYYVVEDREIWELDPATGKNRFVMNASGKITRMWSRDIYLK